MANNNRGVSIIVPFQIRTQTDVDRAWRDGISVGHAGAMISDHVHTVAMQISSVLAVAIAVRALPVNTRTPILKAAFSGTQQRVDKEILAALYDLNTAIEEYSPIIRRVSPLAINDVSKQNLWIAAKLLMDGIKHMFAEINPDDGEELYAVIDTHGTAELLDLSRSIVDATPNRHSPVTDVFRELKKKHNLSTTKRVTVKIARAIRDELLHLEAPDKHQIEAQQMAASKNGIAAFTRYLNDMDRPKRLGGN